MASKYSKAEIIEFQMNAKAMEEWEQGDTNADFLNHCKNAVKVALERELNDRQRQIYVMYYIDGVTIPQIAAIMGVNKSTISRTLKRANERLAKVLRYSAPNLLHAQAKRRNKRITDNG